MGETDFFHIFRQNFREQMRKISFKTGDHSYRTIKDQILYTQKIFTQDPNAPSHSKLNYTTKEIGERGSKKRKQEKKSAFLISFL